MQANRQQQAASVLLVLLVLLACVWTGGLAGPAASHPANQLTASGPLLGIQPTVLPDRVPALRPPVDRPGQSGRLVVLLLGVLAALVAVARGVWARRLRSGLARARSLVPFTQLEARAPPPLQPA